MNFDDYWQRLCRKNPGLTGDERMIFTVDSFRKQLERAFAAGAEATSGRNQQSHGFVDDLMNMLGRKDRR